MDRIPAMRQRSDYHYHLPAAQIAQAPADTRDGSRLLVFDPNDERAPLADRMFADIVDAIPQDAVVVVNDTRVFPARLRTQKPSGGAVELLFLEQLPDTASRSPAEAGRFQQVWRCMARASKRLRPGTELVVLGADGPVEETVTVVASRAPDATIHIGVPADAHALLERRGQVPLPPYISRPEGDLSTDRERYQTVYARERGAVAAPTAGLHFTREILDRLAARGVDIAAITLHVGMGTFAPVRVEDLDHHHMHTERYAIPRTTADAVTSAVRDRRSVVAVGTTCVRALESAAIRARDRASPDVVAPGAAATDLFIRPGFDFRVVDRLLTNFHLPESTLLMLVCAFAGYEPTLSAYAHAVARGYRFFSYGDAMLVTRADRG